MSLKQLREIWRSAKKAAEVSAALDLPFRQSYRHTKRIVRKDINGSQD